jgi:hypothetical protein
LCSWQAPNPCERGSVSLHWAGQRSRDARRAGAPGRQPPHLGKGEGASRYGRLERQVRFPAATVGRTAGIYETTCACRWREALPAPLLAQAYHQGWEHETGNAQLKTHLRSPGKVLRSKSPDMVRQEIYGYLLTHRAISALICKAATEAGIDPGITRTPRSSAALTSKRT